MQVISKQTLIFRVAGHKDYVLHPAKHPVHASEHIRNTHLYKLAVSDGTVQEFVPVVIKPVDDAAEKKATEEKAAGDAKANADAKAQAQAEGDAAKKAEEEKGAAENAADEPDSKAEKPAKAK